MDLAAGAVAFGMVCGWLSARRVVSIKWKNITRAATQSSALVVFCLAATAVAAMYGGTAVGGLALEGIAGGASLELLVERWLRGKTHRT
jgi:hypothetical protein